MVVYTTILFRRNLMYYEMIVQYIIGSIFLILGGLPFIGLYSTMLQYKRRTQESMDYVRNNLNDAIVPMDIVNTFVKDAREYHNYIQSTKWYFYIIACMLIGAIISLVLTGLGYYTCIIIWGYCLGCYMTINARKNVICAIEWFTEQVENIRQVETNYLEGTNHDDK